MKTTHDYRDNLLLLGVFFTTLAVIILLSPGRIDIIDGQFRFEVAYNLAFRNTSRILDPAISFGGLIGRNGWIYSSYGISGSLVALPLLIISNLISVENRELSQFAFSLTSPLLSSATLAALYFGYRQLDISRKHAIIWTFVFGFTTLWLPLSTSVFDQVQNGFFLFLSFLFAYTSRQRNSITQAFIGALAFAILINYKQAYIVFWPGLLWAAGLKLRSALSDIASNRIIQIFIFGGILGVAAMGGFNFIRFGSIYLPPPTSYHPPLFDNLLSGLAILSLSPGKGILWYSPAALVAFYGWKPFWNRHRALASGILIGSILWLILISSLSFSSGEWCWGPRYLVPVLPLLFLATPFSNFRTNQRKVIASIIIFISLIIQIASLYVDHQRFFFQKGLEPFFWYKNEKFYFNNSALVSRVSEISSIASPADVTVSPPFRPGPYSNSLTYAIFGPPSDSWIRGEPWVSLYPVFSLPRPWPLWTLAINNRELQRARGILLLVLSTVFCAGALSIFLGFRSENSTQTPRPVDA